MIIMRVACDCGRNRNLLDVRWAQAVQSQHRHMPRPGWVDVRPRPNVDDRPDRNRSIPGKLDEATHNVTCPRCGRSYRLSEHRLAAAWTARSRDPRRVVRVVLGADV